ncbi:transposase [Paraburkholderia sp. UCT70]
MRQIKEVLRLRFVCQRSQREIATTIGASSATVWDYLDRVRRAQLDFEKAMTMEETALDALLFPPPPSSSRTRPMPNWPMVHRELGRKGVTLDLLWNEYKAQEPEGYGYSWFCKYYERWAAALPVTLRQTHTPGEKLFIDYSGNRLGIVDPHTGEIREAEVFVATLGASNYTYAEVTWTQQLEDWIGSHVRALNFIGGCPEILVPDNLRSGVHKADFYDPVLNRTYGEMAAHYSVAIIPARKRRPRDKAKVEQSVLLAQRWILARLRNQRLFSLDEANRAIAALLVELNNRPFKKLPGCRRSAFEELDRPALRPLPDRPYQYAQWKVARVGIDYHVELDEHFYSVSYSHAREQVEVRHTKTTVEIFLRGQRIAAHAKSERRGHHTTIAAHMPANHRAATTEWNPQRLINWAIVRCSPGCSLANGYGRTRTSFWSHQPGSVKAGLHARWSTRRVARASRPAICACRSSTRRWPSRTAVGATQSCWHSWPRPTSSSWMTWPWHRCQMRRGAICWRCSTTGTAGAR